MKRNIYEITSNINLNGTIWEMKLKGDSSEITKPGQFINIQIDGFYLRRPISICDWDKNSITIIYVIVGDGTKAMSQMKPGHKLDVLCPLGNGYNIKIEDKNPMLVGGGGGLAPMFSLAKALQKSGKSPEIVAGFKSEQDIFYIEKYKELGIDVKIATEDGSKGTKGFVTDVMEKDRYVFACGPELMLKAIYAEAKDGQFDFGARMACGFGACMGCSCKTKSGSKRICKDGPVFLKEDIIW